VTVGLVSLGCAKNAADLETRTAALLADGWTLAPDPDKCDLLVVNTCSFIASAREEAEREIRRALRLKKKGAVGRVIVCGCYPQRYPQAASRFRGVDSWEGVPEKFECRKVPGLRFTGKAFAYLKIAEGCAHKCAYCAIPSIRGKYRSRPLKEILREARGFIKTGARELNIIAQDPMLYGVDMKVDAGGRKINLVSLLRELDRMRGDFKVRVLYSYPSEITDEFLEWMRTSRRAVKYIDVPLQHTDADVLKAMARASAVKATQTAAERIRASVPGVTLRTTVMTGFPGETEARFRKLLADVKRMQFDHLGVFAYSPEEGTAGAEMPDRPSPETAERRARHIMAAQKKIWNRKAKSMLGSVYPALVTGGGVARMESQAPDVDGVTYLVDERGEAVCPPVGSVVDVQLVEALDYDFIGMVVP
jgi:ribosomal protein S12 methylthiotransferase